MESVMSANFYFFKTVIAGDDWGALAWPLLEKYPATATIFVSSFIILSLGFLNLLLVAMMDSAAEGRQDDVEEKARQLKNELEADQVVLRKMFNNIDTQNSGGITLEQLLQSANSMADLQDRLRVMDMDLSDLEQLFYMMDADGGGTIDEDEFTGALGRWMYNDSKTASRFAKYNIQRVLDEQRHYRTLMKAMQNQIDEMRQSIDYLGYMQGIYYERKTTPVTASVGSTATTGDTRLLLEIQASTGMAKQTSPSVSPTSDLTGLLQPLQDILLRVRDDIRKLDYAVDGVALKGLERLLHFSGDHDSKLKGQGVRETECESEFQAVV
eukprot:TRINITY_DN22137_c0_g1_i1.p1 TRINITY_DN22137_c0_g1~~TRINITY_DN22137_c0_g1_i1.p1  ORF type:complete len:359 (+),score=64.73 TRINITY_DN22137_c0_g1_i1:102-1079(+)